MASAPRCPYEDDEDASSIEQTTNCTHYDPFDDDSPEWRIKDLSFALRKLSAMKCQMKKWGLDRLQLESQVRALSKSLRANGVNVETVLKVDPLVTHLRKEYQKVDNYKAALEDELRDLRETLKERECFEDEPCKAVIYAREKMLEVRARCAAEKRRLRETMGCLQLKLEETSARLASELDQQQVSEKSIGELCAKLKELKKENKCLLCEVETLKMCMTADNPKATTTTTTEVEMGELCERVRACECEVTQLRRQLAERDAVICDFERRLQAQRRNSTQLEKVAVSQRALGDQNAAMNKAKQKQKDEKHSSQLDAMKVELEKARACNRSLERTSEKLGNENAALRESKARLESELRELCQRLQRGSDELRSAEENADRMAKELDDFRKQAESSRHESQNQVKCSQDESEKVASERDELAEQISRMKEEAEVSEKELDACRCNLDETRRELEESESAVASAEARHSKLQSSFDDCTSANSKLMTELEQARTELCKLGERLNDTKKLDDQLKAVKCEVDSLKSANAAVNAENACLKRDNESLQQDVESLRRAKETLAADLVSVKVEVQSEKQRTAAEARRQSADAENELRRCRAENNRLQRAMNESERKARDELARVGGALKAEMQAQIEAVNRVTELMNYAEGRATRRPEAPARAVAHSQSEKWSAPEIIQLFDSSRILSAEIGRAEKTARDLESRATKNKSAMEPREESCSEIESEEIYTPRETTEKAARQLFSCAVSPEKQQAQLAAPFDAASWLKSLSLGQLAELHEQICATTSDIVSDDGAKLLRQRIAKRQREVSAKAMETRVALLKEQIRLARVADEMNREFGFALHISVDARMPSGTNCYDGSTVAARGAREDSCLRVGCAVDFDPNRQRRK